jgi:hypothetical protein
MREGMVTLDLLRHPKCKACRRRIAGDVVWVVVPTAGFVPFEDGAEFARLRPYHVKHVPSDGGAG